MRYMVVLEQVLQRRIRGGSILRMLVWFMASLLPPIVSAEPLDHIRVSDDGTHFVHGESAERFIVWGVNYDHITLSTHANHY